MRQICLPLFCCLVASLFVCACSDEISEAGVRPQQEPLPDLASTRGTILISLDTLRADHLGLYGYPLPTSPFLDRLAKRSIVFDNEWSSIRRP